MTTFSWIHISDWHEGQQDFDRSVLLSKLFEDIRARENLHSSLTKIDAVIFSGDIAYSGARQEYQQISAKLVAPLRDLLGGDVQLIFAPGNHDIDRRKIAGIPAEWNSALYSLDRDRGKAIADLVYSDVSSPAVLSPFKEFYDFCDRERFKYENGQLTKALRFTKNGKQLGIVTINTALCCGRYELKTRQDHPSSSNWDYGALTVTERQIREAIAQLRDCEVKALVLHHPIAWLHPSEQPLIEQLVAANFDIVFHGHEHLPRFTEIESNIGQAKFIPAGAAYDRRLAADPRFTNAFSYGFVNMSTREGRVYHRRWLEERDVWIGDDRFWDDASTPFVIRSKADAIPKNRKYSAAIQQQYNVFYTKRPARSADITLVHQPIEIDGEKFVEATVRYKLELHPGPREMFRFSSLANERVLRHPNPNVRSRAFEMLGFQPRLSKSEVDPETPNKFRGHVELSSDEVVVEYKYRILEFIDGIWYFALMRFVDHVKVNIKRAPDLEYEYLGIGGFPNLRPGPDGMLEFETVESGVGHLPHQGYIVQWYPASRKG